MSDLKNYKLYNSFYWNKEPVNENEAKRVVRWLDRRLKAKGIDYYSVGYSGENGEYYIELTDRNIIDVITRNPNETELPRNTKRLKRR